MLQKPKRNKHVQKDFRKSHSKINEYKNIKLKKAGE